MSSGSLVSIGRLSKTHGNEGYITLVLSEFAQDLFFVPDLLWLVTAKSGNKPVPFFLKDSNRVSDQKIRVQFIDYDSIDLVTRLQGATVHMEVSDEQMAEIKTRKNDFLDYSVFDNGMLIGSIEEVYDFSGNIVFSVIQEDQTEIMIPAGTDLIEEIDHDKKQILMILPDGILDQE